MSAKGVIYFLYTSGNYDTWDTSIKELENDTRYWLRKSPGMHEIADLFVKLAKQVIPEEDIDDIRATNIMMSFDGEFTEEDIAKRLLELKLQDALDEMTARGELLYHGDGTYTHIPINEDPLIW